MAAVVTVVRSPEVQDYPKELTLDRDLARAERLQALTETSPVVQDSQGNVNIQKLQSNTTELYKITANAESYLISNDGKIQSYSGYNPQTLPEIESYDKTILALYNSVAKENLNQRVDQLIHQVEQSPK